MAKKPAKESLKAAIYVRVSTTEQSDLEFSSLDGQINQCKTWIDQKNTMGGIDGLQITEFEIYSDTKSGKNLKRPGITRLLNEPERGMFDVVIATKLDRVSRSLKDFLLLYDELSQHSVALTIVTQNIDTTTIQGELLQTMLMAFAEFERKMNSERTREKRIESIKAGLWTGGYQILGYDLQNKKLVVNTEEAELVNEIFQRYLNLKSASKVARSLNNDGYTNKKWVTSNGLVRGGSKFYKKSLYHILKRHIYIGKYEMDGVLYEGLHEQIIDQETFDKVQSILAQNSVDPKAHRTSETPAVLTNLCSCGFCSSGMTVTSTTNKRYNKKYHFYKCVKKNNEGKTLAHNPKDLSVSLLDGFVINSLKIFLEEPELLSAMKKRIKYHGEDKVKEIEQQIAQLQKVLKAKKKDKTNTLQLLTDNAESSLLKQTYEKQLEDILLEIQEKEDLMDFYSQQLDSLTSQSPIHTSTYKSILKEFVDQYEKSDIDTRRDLVKVLVNKVESLVNQETNEGTIEIQYKADKALQAEWMDIKNANSQGKVRIKGLLGSPGWIRTNDRSVNSRLLCH